MIINSREFSIRLTIGTLISAIAFLVVFGFSNYDAVSTENQFVKHEKKLLQNELSELLKNYNELGDETSALKSQLIKEQTKIDIAQDSLWLLKADVALIPKLRNQLKVLSAQQSNFKPEVYTSVIDSLVEGEQQKEKLISVQKNVILTLEEEKEQLKDYLALGKLVFANSFEAQALDRRKSGNVITNKASKAEYVDVCFMLGENPIAENALMDIYIQVLGPDNNVVSDRGSVEFGENLLIYSHKIQVQYNKKNQEVCTAIYNKDEFKKGSYLISVFHQNRKLGTTEFSLQ